jgi:hypothetical protein
MENMGLNLRRLFLFFVGISFISCTTSTNDAIQVFSSAYDFNVSRYDWSGDYADYKIKDSSQVRFQFDRKKVPEAMGSDRQSVFLSGDNLGENLFLFIKKKITGLTPNTDYTIAFDVELICEVGQLSDDSIWLKAGATMMEPKKTLQGEFMRMDIDKGPSSSNGQDMIIIGTIDTSANNTDWQEYGLIQSGISSSQGLYVTAKTNASGDVWLILGIESQHEGTISAYITKAIITFSVSNR